MLSPVMSQVVILCIPSALSHLRVALFIFAAVFAPDHWLKIGTRQDSSGPTPCFQSGCVFSWVLFMIGKLFVFSF